VIAMNYVGLAPFFVVLGACALLVAAALWPRRRAADPAAAPARIWLLLAPLEFLALWLWLAPLLELFLWVFIYGDNLTEHLIDVYARWPALVIAASASVALAIRLLRGSATRRFARVHLCVTAALLASFGALKTYEFASGIYGTTAESAAQNVLAGTEAAWGWGERVRLVERTDDLPPGADPRRYQAFWIMGAEEPRGCIAVARYGWFWWTLASQQRYGPSRAELDRARRAIDEGNTEGAARVLRLVIEHYPDTPAEAEARRLLETLPRPS
jgi:hypothetical protein